MSKKIVLMFLAGVFLAAAVFGAIALVNRKNQPGNTVSVQTVSLEARGPGQVSAASIEPLPAPTASPVPASPLTQASSTPAFSAIFSPDIDEHSIAYIVAKGDNLTRIAKRYGTTVELIQKVNSMSTDRLRVGMKLKVPTYKFSVVVDKSQNTLILKGDEAILKTYVVSTGSNNSTPVGVFKVTDKLVNPTWYKAGAVVPPGSSENVLGTRWIGINKPGYGIHGTTEPEKLGTQCTAGCVRMRTEEVEELYQFLPPSAEVTIVD